MLYVVIDHSTAMIHGWHTNYREALREMKELIEENQMKYRDYFVAVWDEELKEFVS